MKINISNKINQTLKSKAIFAVLFSVFVIFTVFVVTNQTSVKGEISKEYLTVIWDDSKHILVKSAFLDPKEVLSQGNIEVYPEDVVETDLILDPVVDGGIGQKITIKRSPVYRVSVDGATKEIRSWDASVSAIVKKSAVILGPKDQISPDQNTLVTQGATITITRINETDVDVYEDIDFTTINKGSASVIFGQKQVVQEGKKGQVKKTYHVMYRNGVEISRWLTGSVVTISKQDRTVASGIVTGRANFGYYSGMVTAFYKGMTGRYLLVTNLANGKQVKVKIIGSGPFNGPILDMGTEPFQAIGGKLSDGYIPSVSVQLLD